MRFRLGIIKFNQESSARAIAGVRAFIDCPSMRIDFLGFKRERTYLVADCTRAREIDAGDPIPRYNINAVFNGEETVRSVEFVDRAAR